MNVEYDEATGVAIFRPQSPLSKTDFAEATGVVDPIIAKQGRRSGLIICTQSFPDWESLAGLIAHKRFVQEHHRKIHRVALVTGSSLGTVAEKLAEHFVAAKIRHFPYIDLAKAKLWAAGLPYGAGD